MKRMPDIVFRFLFVMVGWVVWMGLSCVLHVLTGASEVISMNLVGVCIIIACVTFLEVAD